jgi:AraC-like DNA-binding protein
MRSLAGDDSLTGFIADRAREGHCDAGHPGVFFHRAPEPKRFHKSQTFGAVLTVVAQGRKVARFGSLELYYEPCHHLVITGETTFEGEILEASPARPYLAVCIELPPELIAKTLLALADAQAAPSVTALVPAFVGPTEPEIKDAVVRFLRANDDPIERRLLAPLVLEELVLRLLRSDAAAVLRRAIVRERDAESIQQAMRFMRANSSRSLTVEQVARHVAMSPSHFAHRFALVARTSPMRFLKEVRLQEARSLLVTGTVRVNEAAQRVGYESASHFTRDFKGRFGATPAAYQRRQQQIAGSGEKSAALHIVGER